MPLLVSLARPAATRDLGAFEEVTLGQDELYGPKGRQQLIARHRHNRWSAAEDSEGYVSLEIVGPLKACGELDPRETFGPYQLLSTYDGVLYVEHRTFGFWDRQNQDWYITDAGAHLKRVRISFHATD